MLHYSKSVELFIFFNLGILNIIIVTYWSQLVMCNVESGTFITSVQVLTSYHQHECQEKMVTISVLEKRILVIERRSFRSK